MANFRNFALTCFAHHNLNPNFINFHTPNQFLSNITFVPHTNTFPTITHMPMLGFSKWHFRRDDYLGTNGEFTLNLEMQAIARQITRPNQFIVLSAFTSTSFWASHAPVQAHAWRTQSFMHTSLAHHCLDLSYK